ncbi:MAG: hypothetical protein GX809_02375 [Clostridiaceae bacterium]|nr:hypothetical protein [Clostridiaceae bacterium]
MIDSFSWYAAHGISREVFELSQSAMHKTEDAMARIDYVREKRQLEVLAAFIEAGVSESAFNSKTGYGYDDLGREQTEAVFARAFKAEDALVRLQFSSGTHVLATCLRALLTPGDDMLIVTGRPYDSLLQTLGHVENVVREQGSALQAVSSQSLTARGISVRQVDLLPDDGIDLEGISSYLRPTTRLVYIQKSRGYAARPALTNQDIGAIVKAARKVMPDVIIFIDHCYSEFVEADEPLSFGADLIAGSLIKNPGSGIAPGGGYIAGRKDLIEEISEGMTAVGVGRHVGPSFGLTRLLLQGLYLAPTVVATAMKGAVHLAALFKLAGYHVAPLPDGVRGDIVQLVRLESAEKLDLFCSAVQSTSPVDAYLTPIPAPMPGYDCEIIMAAGSFVQGSTIELSADGPVRPPYNVFMQGALTFEQSRLAAMKALESVGYR